MRIRVAIVGPTGYTGYWLIEGLLRHPAASITYLGSGRQELPNIASEFPSLLRRCELDCRPIDPAAMAAEADVAFVCLPHRAAMQHVPALLDAGLRVVDLSADYRLADPDTYHHAYGETHGDPENLRHAIYGLPELFPAAFPAASLVANPGCYPTAAALAIGPLLQRSLVRPEGLVINAASGITGAGRSPKPHLHLPEMNEGFTAYKVGQHRHQPEIAQSLARVRGGPVEALFVPHLLPIDRGILESIYLDPTDGDIGEAELLEAFDHAYGQEPFIRLRRDLPNVKDVRDTNFCDIAVRRTGGKVVVFSAIDNMIKGASGQAIQNMNLMFERDPTDALL